MFTVSHFKYLYLAYFSRPASDRALYRTIRRQKVRRILEIGVGQGERALRMIDLAQRCSQGQAVRYVGIDLFEARGKDQAPGLSIKEAHRRLQATKAQVQLVPGDPSGALARSANSLPNIDLVLISAEQTDEALAKAWFYLPRMLHASSHVYRETPAADGQMALSLLAPADIEARAVRPRRAA